MIVDYEKLTAPCGLDCFNCPLLADKASLKTFLFSNIGHLVWFKKFNFNWSKSACSGCRAEQGKCKAVGLVEGCRTYTCSKKKGVEFCHECSDFPCDLLHPRRNKAFFPHNTKVFNLLLIKKMGLEEWSKEKANKVRNDYLKEKLKL